MDYCSEDDFKNNICSINNTIVKTQWLNNIIWIGDKFFSVLFRSLIRMGI